MASLEDVSIDDIRNHKIDQYKKNGLSYTSELIDEEIVSDMIGAMAQDKNSVQKLYNSLVKSGTNESFAQRIVRKIKELLMNLKLHFVNLNGKYNSAIAKAAKENRPSDSAFSEYLDKINSILSQSFDNLKVTENEGEAKWSINPDFAKKYDKWNKKNIGFAFKVGTTSEALQSIGVDDKSIYWDASKILKIKKDHPKMTDNVIKQVPNILETPVLIMESLTVKDRLTLFGEVYDESNNPVLAVLELNPKDKYGQSLSIIKIASAYGKDTNPQRLINNSKVLYVNKNGINRWLSVNRLKLPLPSFSTDSTNTIPQNDTIVNDSISKNGENDTKFSIRETDSGEKIVVIDTDQGIFLNTDEKEQIKIATKYMNDNFKNKHLPLSDYNVVVVDKTGINKYRYLLNKVEKSINKAKFKASTELDNLLRAAEYSYSSKDHKAHDFAEYGFDYYTVKFVVGGQMFEGRIDIGVSPKGATFYGMNKIKRVTDNSSLVLANLVLEDTQSSHRNSLINNNISQNDTIVNNSISENGENDTRFSLKEDVDKIPGVAYNNTKKLSEHNEYEDFMPSGAMGKEIRNKVIQSFVWKRSGNSRLLFRRLSHESFLCKPNKL